MTGTMYGADVAQLRALGDRLDHAADALDQSGRLLSQGISPAMSWRGPDAQAFQGEWSGSYLPTLQAAARALRDAARAIRANADQQETASAVGPGTAVPATAVLPPLSGTDSVRPYGIREMLDQPFLGITTGVRMDWGDVVGLAPVVGTAASAISLFEAITDPGLSGPRKAYEVGGYIWDEGAGVAKKFGPVGYLTGVAMLQLHDVTDAALEADFSTSGVKMVVDEIARDPWGSAVVALNSAGETLGKTAVNLAFW